MTDKIIIASLGGGFTSSALMPRVLLEQYDKAQIKFINCVLPNEHPDTWKLFDAIEENLGIKIIYIAYHPDEKWQYVDKLDRNNRDLLFTPFDIFFKKGFMGNHRNDPCSSMLKRETIYNYVSSLCEQNNTLIAAGIHADEFERSAAIRKNWESKGWRTIFPVIEGKYILTREQQLDKLQEWYGVSLDLYEKGFTHNNCAGACIKSGQRQWAQLWYYYPEVYDEWEILEQDWNDMYYDKYNKSYNIVKFIRNNKIGYISLKEFRENILIPASMGESSGFIAKMIESLPGNPACMWCEAI